MHNVKPISNSRDSTTPPPSDDVILAPKLINSKADDTKKVVEFKVQGKNYIRCNALTKRPKHMRQRTSPIWLQGEDLQLKEGDSSIIYYYCYIYKRLEKPQELSILTLYNTGQIATRVSPILLSLLLIYLQYRLYQMSASDSLAAARSFLATGVFDYK